MICFGRWRTKRIVQMMWGTKQLVHYVSISKRRERLDQEHGVDRDQMTENFEKLDELFRVSEKKEIEKFNRIGKTTKEFYERK